MTKAPVRNEVEKKIEAVQGEGEMGKRIRCA